MFMHYTFASVIVLILIFLNLIFKIDLHYNGTEIPGLC